MRASSFRWMSAALAAVSLLACGPLVPAVARLGQSGAAAENNASAPATRPAAHKRLSRWSAAPATITCPRRRHLAGPANDVALMRQLLTERFGFDDFQVLTEEAGPDHRPTAGNIRRQFDSLIERTQPGDQVFILLAGHEQPAARRSQRSRS